MFRHHSIYEGMWNGRVDLNSFINILNDPNFDPNIKDENGFTLIQYFYNFNDQRCEKLRLLLEYGVDINVLFFYRYDSGNMTLFQRFIQNCCNSFGGDFHLSVKKFVVMVLDHGLNIYHANPKGITNIKYLTDKIKTKTKNKCYCKNKDRDPVWCLFNEFCSRCLTIKYLNIVLDEINSFNNRKTTFFQLMLPNIKKYRPPSNRQQRIK